MALLQAREEVAMMLAHTDAAAATAVGGERRRRGIREKREERNVIDFRRKWNALNKLRYMFLLF